MKPLNQPLASPLRRTTRAVLLLAALCLSCFDGLAEPVVRVEVVSATPAENALAAFTGEDEPDGWGWLRTENEHREIALSFICGEDGQVGVLYLKMQRVPATFLGESAFRLRVFRTESLEENPVHGELVFEGNGLISLTEADGTAWLSLSLPEPIPATAGSVLTFCFDFEQPEEYNVVVFETQSGFTEGRIWFREADAEHQDFIRVPGEQRPGIVFFTE